MRTPAALAVVIPARDEEELLPGCLDSVAWSAGSNFYGEGKQPGPENPVLLWNRGEYACDPDLAPGSFPGEPGEHTTSCPDLMCCPDAVLLNSSGEALLVGPEKENSRGCALPAPAPPPALGAVVF